MIKIPNRKKNNQINSSFSINNNDNKKIMALNDDEKC
jgi:hypothetical protein